MTTIEEEKTPITHSKHRKSRSGKRRSSSVHNGSLDSAMSISSNDKTIVSSSSSSSKSGRSRHDKIKPLELDNLSVTDSNNSGSSRLASPMCVSSPKPDTKVKRLSLTHINSNSSVSSPRLHSPNSIPYNDGVLNVIDEDKFDKNCIPFCFKCEKVSPPYITTTEKTGYKICGDSHLPIPVYREVYICGPCFKDIERVRFDLLSNRETLCVNIAHTARMLYTECRIKT